VDSNEVFIDGLPVPEEDRIGEAPGSASPRRR
jgi:alkylation response protein AidB-like acyl-CoA dehydrogenase